MEIQARSRVVFFLPNLQMGGAESMTVLLASWLAQEGVGMSRVVLHVQSSRLAQLSSRLEGTDVTVLHGLGGYLRLLLSTVLYGRLTTFVAATETYPVLLAFVAHLLCLGSRLVLWLHTDPCRYFMHMPRFAHLYRCVARLGSSQIVCVSSAVARQLDVFIGRHVPSVVIHNAIDPIETAAIRNACRGKTTSPSRIGYVGRVSTEKGIEDLLQLFIDPNFGYSNREISLSVYTDEVGAQSLRPRIAKLPRCEVMTGVNKDRIYSAVGTVVIASKFEGFSLVCLEAMTGGLNIVYRRELDAVRELLEIARYPAKRRFEFSTSLEMAEAIAKASASLGDESQNESDLSLLGFPRFVLAWRQLVQGGPLLKGKPTVL